MTVPNHPEAGPPSADEPTIPGSDREPTVAEPKRRRWVWPVATAVALFAGIGIGAAGGGDTDLSAEPEPAPTVTAPGAVPQEQLDELAAREAEIDQRETDLAEREAAVSETETNIAEGTITEGIWTVGVDIAPGTYRATGVPEDCYWAITTSGSNGADIIENGIPGGGNPTVTLEEGQDFTTTRCGDWTLVP
jgi:hypothetical protein